MKKIVFSIVALTSLAFSSQAQVHVTQGTLGDNTQQGNSAKVNQQTDVVNYVISVFSPNSEASVKQIYNASAVGNWVGTVQNGSANSALQTQSGSNNNIYLTQINNVSGLISGNGNQVDQSQGGENNVQSVYQSTSSSVADNGGSVLFIDQKGEGNSVTAQQIGHGVGHSSSIIQGADLTNSFASATQFGSDNVVSINQTDGDNNGINVTQNNPSSDKAGNTLTVTQGGGDDNYIVFTQTGSNNDAVIAQDGSSNEIAHTSRQIGSGNTATLTQIGSFRYLESIQEGNGNTITALQHKSESTGMVIQSIQLGNNNAATITQGGL